MRCAYCYNTDIVYAKNGTMSFNDVLDFLRLRVGRLDGVVLSGGEATTHHLIEFAQEIKNLGYKLKLDTNGTNFKQVAQLVELELLDYIALDYKAPQYKFLEITKSMKYNEFSKTLDYLLSTQVSFEVRTTLHADLLNENDVNEIISDLTQRGYQQTYYIQEFMDTKTNIGKLIAPKSSFEKHKLLKKLNIVFR